MDAIVRGILTVILLVSRAAEECSAHPASLCGNVSRLVNVDPR